MTLLRYLRLKMGFTHKRMSEWFGGFPAGTTICNLELHPKWYPGSQETWDSITLAFDDRYTIEELQVEIRFAELKYGLVTMPWWPRHRDRKDLNERR